MNDANTDLVLREIAAQVASLQAELRALCNRVAALEQQSHVHAVSNPEDWRQVP